MELIAKISKGSKMDQIYLTKRRVGFDIGDYVIIEPLEKGKYIEKPYFYKVDGIESAKLEIIKEIIGIVDRNIENENIIITGSFLDKGFNFNDIDIIIITKDKSNTGKVKIIEKFIKKKIGVKIHLVILNNKALLEGLSTDPLYQMMLSKCISKKRLIYKIKNKIDYKILDLHLLKSKILINNFDMLNGNEKYSHIRNVTAIYLYLKDKKINKELVDNEIKEIFNLKDIENIKQNILDKKDFLQRYKSIYNKTFNKIMKGIKNGAKQK